MAKERPTSLNDIKLRCDCTQPMDKGIVDLTKAVNLFGIYTLSSCEGHIKRRFANKPQVTFSIKPEDTSAMMRASEIIFGRYKDEFLNLIESFNSRNFIKWKFNKSVYFDDLMGDSWLNCISLEPKIEPANTKMLLELQESAQKLAVFIFGHVISRGDFEERESSRIERYNTLLGYELQSRNRPKKTGIEKEQS